VFGLLVLVVSIGFADSLNPTTIAPAVYLATTERAQVGLVTFTIGVFSVYLLGGLLITLGPGQLLLAALPHPDPHIKHEIELAVGSLALVVAAILWITRSRVQARVPDSRHTGPRSAFFLGAGISAVELPTAFPYFGAIAAIVGSGYVLPYQLLLLVIFNVVFVAPLVAIIFVRRIGGERAKDLLTRFGDWLHKWSSALIAGLIALVGVIAITIGALGLARGTPHTHHVPGTPFVMHRTSPGA
jgi:cytochrome c biogenesis protein CcdA